MLVLEAGGKDNWIWFHIPVGYLFAIGNPRSDWMFTTGEEAGLGGRSLAYPRGKVIGGSSAINAMIYMRGQAADYDGWRQLGLTGWGWDDVLPFFLKHEDHADGPSAFHGAGGEWRVEHPRMRWAILDAVRDAAEAAGIPKVSDFNTGDNEGSSLLPGQPEARPALERGAGISQTRPEAPEPAAGDRRPRGAASSSTAGAPSASPSREDGRRRSARAEGEVILAAGAIGSPTVLELSGIGQGDRLRELGIAVVHDLPGVGENLQDHLQLRPVFRVEGARTLNEDYARLWKRGLHGVRVRVPSAPAPSPWRPRSSACSPAPRRTTPPPTSNSTSSRSPSTSGARACIPSRPSRRASATCARRAAAACISAIPRPGSRRRSGPTTCRRRRTAASRPTRSASPGASSAQEPLRRFKPQEVTPGAELTTEEELVRAAGAIGTTIFHPVGTAKMGVEGDPLAVLDERLRVRGIERLRVIDASAMPRITSGNTNSPTVMIGEKGAAMVLEDAR